MQKDSKLQSKTISKIGISIIASVLLSQNLVAADIPKNALPAGGKFTHGSGSIKVNGKEMNITGNNTNHIIAWGGGFNIGKDAEVNFNTSHGRQASFLNLDYTNKASQILGKLNGNNHNIYLVNPSGVLIGQNANINANKFVASNIIDDTTLNNFKNKVNDTNAITTFSPVFKPNKGNIVNLGSIRAKEIVLIGNEVRNQAIIKENGKETIITGSFSGYDDKKPNSKIQNDSITLVGNIVDINIDTDVINSKQVWIAAKDKARINQSTSDIYFNGNRLVGNNALKTSNDLNTSNIKSVVYNGITNPKSIETYASIKDITDWYYFANGWNNNQNNMKDIQNFELINNIDFSEGNKICLKANCDTQNGIKDVDYFTFSGNYADPNGDDNYDDSMIVGGYYAGGYYAEGIYNPNPNPNQAFSKNFNGGGHTLSNIDIDIDIDIERNLLFPSYENYRNIFAGIFGYINGSSNIGNLVIDKINVEVKSDVKRGSGAITTYMGGFAGLINGATLSNIVLNNIGTISNTIASYKSNRDINKLYLGGFVGGVEGDSKFSSITLNKIGTINNKTQALSVSYLGGFAGSVGNIIYYDENNAFFSDIVLNEINTIMSDMSNMSNSTYLTSSTGGFAGYIDEAILSNIVLNNIRTISGIGVNNSNSRGSVSSYSGGFAGEVAGGSNYSTFSNIVLNNIGNINANIVDNRTSAIAGGFAGSISASNSTFSNIVLNNIGNISSEGINNDRGGQGFIVDSGTSTFTGGFAGGISASNSTFSNIVLNNIGNISSEGINDKGGQGYSHSGGFAGSVTNFEDSNSTYSNIVLNNIGTISSKSNNNAIKYNTITSSGGFIGYVVNFADLTFENIYLYFDLNSTILAEAMVAHNGSKTVNKGKFYGSFNNFNPSLSNIHLYYKDGTLNGINSDSKDYHSSNPNGQIFLNPYVDSTQAINNFHSALESANSSVFKDNPILWNQDSNGNYNYYFANSVTSTPTPPNINDSTTNTLPTLDMDNLFNKGGYFDSSSWLTKDDFNQSILDSILGKDNQGNSNLIFDLLTQDLESIRQSLDFLVSFLDGENDIKELFGDYYKVNDNIYGALNQDLTINLKFSNFIEALKQNKNINLAFLKDYRDKLNTYNQNKELYQSGGLPPLEQESLKKLLKEQYNELLNLEQIAKTNLESLQELIKDSFKMDTNYTIFAKESLSPLNFTINIGSLDNFEDTQGNGDNNNRFTPRSEVQKIADLASKEAILILPAQEKQEAIVEDGKERGRLCIVSDNAKTNNPCMAITY
ncbi:filamentous hemagglutinin N-terminal domain-containing protein [Helicobacter pullorum]|uniref:filamentous hemagglutinin N-terminal domain-containing protein n=1 Tax=Helicobacter pullorum TaxID=35818 RepID=UPI003FA0B365